MKHFMKVFLMLTGAGFIITSAGCKTAEIVSSPRTQEINIDGDYSDWQNRLVHIEDQNFSAGFQHDDAFFYVCLITSDPQIGRMVMGRGLVLQFDSGSKKSGGIAIKYPIGRMGGGMSPDGFRDRENNPGSEMGMVFDNLSNEVEIQLPSDEEFERFLFSELTGTGLEVRSAMRDENWVYEMKIPLKRDESHPYALGDGDVHQVKIQIETPEINRGASSERAGGPPLQGGDSGGGMGGPGGGGMRGRGMGGGPPGGPGQGWGSETALKISLGIKLETSPTVP